MRFGDYAMEQLLNTIYRKGGQRGRIEFKIFGGARVLGGSTMLKIGEQNIDFVEKFLKNEGFPIVAPLGRRHRAAPAALPPRHGQGLRPGTRPHQRGRRVTKEEEQYRRKIAKVAPAGGDVEFF